MPWATSILGVCDVRLRSSVVVLAPAAILLIAVSRCWGLDSDSTLSSRKPSNSERGASNKVDVAKAQQLVNSALFVEIAGDNESRAKNLDEALSAAPGYAPAMWHSGQIQYQNRWVTPAQIGDLTAHDARLAAYRSRRDRTADTAVGQTALAQWCESAGLQEQAKAHWNRVLELDPNNRAVRAKLGHRQIAGQWFTQAEFERRTKAQADRIKLVADWLPKVSPIIAGLLSDDERERSAAQKQFEEIDDIASLPALEYASSLLTEEIADQFINKVSQWSGSSVSNALSRQAVYSPWELTRQLAAQKLHERPREEFVPQLLAAMYSPVVRTTWVGIPAGGRDPARGQLTYRQVSMREGRDSIDIDARTTIYHPESTSRTNSANTLNQTAWEMRMQKARDELAATLENMQISEVNQRVMKCLSTATDRTALVSPDDWWNWWDEENETKYAAEKANRVQNLQRDVVVADDQYSPPIVTSSEWYAAPPPRHSCFAAGTPVWTSAGSKAIETVRIGDLVLSQSADSGELTYKPVLRTTVRNGSQLFAIETSGTTLKATGGHLFWVAGQGWTKARNLRSGQTLHCATGTVQVSLVTEEPQPEQTYNLVVADFNTYFVGPEKILSHDVTEKKPTRSIVPGLARD